MAKKTNKKPREDSGRKKPRKGCGDPAASPDAETDQQPALDGAEAGLPDFPIVGVGASAGGLEAFSALLEEMQQPPGAAIVLVQHLSAAHASSLPRLLGAKTAMPLDHAEQGAKLQPNHVYVIPPGKDMTVTAEGALHLTPRATDKSQYTPIDTFFRSLAEYAQSRAIGVVLSGNASDGALGLRHIKGAGGITLAQDPASAQYDGMPRAAIATDMVDLVLTPTQMAHELARIGRGLMASAVSTRKTADQLEIGDDQLLRIFALLRAATGVDFRHYKPPTIKRRIHRRMVLHRLDTIEGYLHLLEATPAEIGRLYSDILIHVTHFFRDPSSFETLKQLVLPRIVEDRPPNAPIRIWVPGCSTGEEPYSIAITLLEYLDGGVHHTPVQIFATDLSETAIDQARTGIYRASIASDVSPERLRRFFAQVDGSYQINKLVRDMCVFARQDLTRDPPFSKLDLILCRNVLIYLGPLLQKRLMNVFHYALQPEGFLMLGNAETVGTHNDLFAVVDKKHKIYHKKSVKLHAQIQFPARSADPFHAGGLKLARPDSTERSVQQEANRLLLDRYAPPGVIVDTQLQIVQFRGQTGYYLEPAPGEASLNLLKMAREGMLHGLRSALRAARTSDQPVRREGLRIRFNGHTRSVNLEIAPLGPRGPERHYLVTFEDVTERESPNPISALKGPANAEERSDAGTIETIERLEQELAASREYMQSAIQDLEAVNEELQSANEEILSSNEELQSTNEELDTAKEELQSTNEELNTVNDELQGRNEELSRVNSDLMNLLNSVQIAIVMVSNDLRIRRFTPVAERVLNLIPTDVGRPIGHIKPNIDLPDLEDIIRNAIDAVATTDRNVQDRQGHWYSLRVRPYKSLDNRIDGAVLALVDINAARDGRERTET